MNPSRSPDPSASRQLPHRLSTSRARQSSFSLFSPGDQVPITPASAGAENPQEQNNPTITDEISEIKRYEDFTTIDWVQDAVHEQTRRRARRERGAQFWDKEGTFGWRRKVSEAYDAGQAWLVITIVGAAIGLNSAALNIITEWLSDIKLGHCTTAFYLNESFCCWEAEDGAFPRSCCLPACHFANSQSDRMPRVEELELVSTCELCCILYLCRGSTFTEYLLSQY